MIIIKSNTCSTSSFYLVRVPSSEPTSNITIPQCRYWYSKSIPISDRKGILLLWQMSTYYYVIQIPTQWLKRLNFNTQLSQQILEWNLIDKRHSFVAKYSRQCQVSSFKAFLLIFRQLWKENSSQEQEKIFFRHFWKMILVVTRKKSVCYSVIWAITVWPFLNIFGPQ